jgi:hypothetical protein
MKHITVLLAITLTVGGLAGCTTEVDTGTSAEGRPIGASSTAALPPKDALLAAVRTLDTTAHSFTIKQGTKTGNGRIDPTAKTASMGMGGQLDGGGVENLTVSVAYTVIAPDFWVKADFGKDLNQLWSLDPATWMLFDRSKFDATATLPVDQAGAPKLGVTELFRDGLADVQRTDATHFTGTVDVTAADTILAPSTEAVKKAGAKAKALPFTATTDGQGRLTAFAIDGGSIDPDLALQLTFTGFGAIQPVTEPTPAAPAPASAYDLFS